MIVCLCRGVSERTVRLVVAQGARTVDEVADTCGAGSRCGTCRPDVERLIDREGAAAAAGLGANGGPCGGCPLGVAGVSSPATVTTDAP